MHTLSFLIGAPCGRFWKLVPSLKFVRAMNTALSRLNAVFAFSLSVLASLTFLCFLSTAFTGRGVPAHVKAQPNVNVKLMQNLGREQKDMGVVQFDISANFSHLFDWNTKQLFVLLAANYRTKKNVVNQVVLWDKIIRRGDSPLVELHTAKSKYGFFDDGRGLLGNTNVTLELRWNVIPHAGRLPLIGSGRHRFQFPSKYS